MTHLALAISRGTTDKGSVICNGMVKRASNSHQEEAVIAYVAAHQ